MWFSWLPMIDLELSETSECAKLRSLIEVSQIDLALKSFEKTNSLLKFVWKRYTIQAFVRLGLLLLSAATVMSLGALLGIWASGFEHIPICEHQLSTLGLSVALLLMQVVIAHALTRSELVLRRAFYADCAVVLSATAPSNDEYASFDRACSRDVLALSDCLSSSISVISSPIILIMGFMLLAIMRPTATAATAIAFIFVIGLTWLLSRRGVLLAEIGTDIGRIRMNLSSSWIEHGRLLLNWGLQKPLLKRLHAVAQLEVSVMNGETVIRSLESFLATFALAFPLLGAALISWLLDKSSVDALASAWGVASVLVTLLAYPLSLSECRRGDRHLNSLQAGWKRQVISERLTMPSKFLVFEDKWHPFLGSLVINVDPNNEDEKLAQLLLTRMHLTQEIDSSGFSDAVKSKGTNLSTGQISRLMLARAMHAAEVRGLTLHVAATLSSIDEANLKNVMQAAQLLTVPITWANETIKRFDQKSSPVSTLESSLFSKKIQNVGKKQSLTSSSMHHVKSDSFINIKWILQFTLFVPSVLASSLLALIATYNQKNAANLAAGIFTCSVFGVAAGIFASYVSERASRRDALKNHASLMLSVGNFSPTDLLQRVGRDYTTVLGRLTWYRADIAFSCALIIVAIFSVIYDKGILGACLILIYAISAWILWTRSSPLVIKTRQKTIDGINDYLDHVGNIKWMSGIFGVAVNSLKLQFATQGLISLWITQSNALIAKAKMSIYAMGLTNLLLSTFLILAINDAHLGAMVVVVTTLLAISGASSQFTLALLGFSAQSNSLNRIKVDNKNDFQGIVDIRDGVFHIQGFEDDASGISYNQ